jgi:hypothetical protein
MFILQIGGRHTLKLHMFRVDYPAFTGYFSVGMFAPNPDVILTRTAKKEIF